MTRGIFYIGSHKTGSSALQEHLTLNSQKLLDDGVLYPFIEPDGIAYSLAKTMLNHHVKDLPFKIKSPHNHIAYKLLSEAVKGYSVPKRYRPLPAFATMMQTVRAMMAQTNVDRLLLCSEVFSQIGIQAPHKIKTLINKSGVDQAEVYCVLRRPDQYLASWQSQVLKFGAPNGRLSDQSILRFVGTCHLEFKSAVAPWRKQVGADNLTLVNYADLRNAGGSISHFEETFDLQIKEPIVANVENTGLPYAAYETIRRANGALGKDRSGFLRWYIQAAHKIPLPANNEVELFGAENRLWLVDNFTSDNKGLGEMIGQDMFFPDIEEARATHSMSEKDASEMGFAAIRARYLKRPARQRNAQVTEWLNATTSLNM